VGSVLKQHLDFHINSLARNLKQVYGQSAHLSGGGAKNRADFNRATQIYQHPFAIPFAIRKEDMPSWAGFGELQGVEMI